MRSKAVPISNEKHGLLNSAICDLKDFLVIFSVRSKSNLHFDKDNVESRQKNITLTFNKLMKLAQVGLCLL